jgi:hypothetical protein
MTDPKTDDQRERVTLWRVITALFDHLCWEPRNPRCMFGQHDEMEVRERGEIFLRCVDCARRSPGLQIDGAPVHKFDGDPARHRAVPPAVSTGPGSLKIEVFESMEALAAALRTAEGDDEDEFTTIH